MSYINLPMACGCVSEGCRRYGCRLNRQQWNQVSIPQTPRGCICPPTSEQTCKANFCPRKSSSTASPDQAPSTSGPVGMGSDHEGGV